VREKLAIPTQICVLAHVTTTLELIRRGTPVDLVFQSIGGTEGTNRSFGISLALLHEAHEAARSLKRGTVGNNLMYFETGQGSALSAGQHVPAAQWRGAGHQLRQAIEAVGGAAEGGGVHGQEPSRRRTRTSTRLMMRVSMVVTAISSKASVAPSGQLFLTRISSASTGAIMRKPGPPSSIGVA